MPYATKRQAHKATTTDNAAAQGALNDVYQRITDQIIAAIEAGAGKWEMPWHSGDDGAGMVRPVNATTGKPYRGVNVLALWIAAQDKGYATSEWATYKQWQEKGAQVRKGEKSQFVVFWKINDQEGETQDGGNSGNGGEQTDNEPSGRRVFARGYAVFNAAQVDGYTPAQPETPPATPSSTPRNPEAETFFTATGADIRHGGNRAFYKPGTDHIQMPPFEAFPEATDYYSVLGHETVHWTSAEKRLDRDLSGRFGNEAYAAEELIAELGAAFLCADLGLANTPRPDHAAYVASWLKVLKNDSHAIFTAASRAQAATDYLHGLQEQAQPRLLTAPPAP